MCKREEGVTSSMEARDSMSHGSMPRTFTVGSENELLCSEGLTAGDEGGKLWRGEQKGSPLSSLQPQRLGDWSLTVIRNSTADSPATSVEMSNSFFGSRIQFAADGTVIWLSNPIADKCLVISPRSANVSSLRYSQGQALWEQGHRGGEAMA